MSHKSGHIIIQRLTAPLLYGETTPATGLGKYAGMLRVWHVIVIAFLAGLPL